jgi:predicted acetyltransferase
MMQLVWPRLDYLPSYKAALERGWSPDNIRGAAATREELEAIAADAKAFVESLVDREAKGPPIKQPDGSTAPRLPGFYRWMWDGEFCGSINFRWQPGTPDLPVRVPGHIGFSVVAWKRRRGYATQALKHMVGEARKEGLAYVDVTCDEDNVASQGVIRASGGTLVERFTKLPQHGGKPSLRFRIPT